MLRRPLVPKLPAPEPPPAPEFTLVDVNRLQLVMVNGLPLQFDMEQREDHKWEDAEMQIVVTLGQRVIRIPRERILYYETFPTQVKQFKQPLTPDQLSALQNQ